MCKSMAWRCVALLGTLAALWLPSSVAANVGLPDGRVYEAVSPVAAEGHAQAYVPEAGALGYTDPNSKAGGVTTSRPFAVAADGEQVAYPGDPPAVGGGGSIGQSNGDEYLATRAPGGGWTQADIQPLGNPSAYLAFADDLKISLLDSFAPLAPDAPASCEVLYSRTNADGAYTPAFTTTQTPGECGVPTFAGASADGADVLFESSAALIAPGTEGQSNLYYSAGGQLELVNVLSGGEVVPDAVFGGPPQGSGGFEHQPDAEHAISADGSRVFWTALDSEGQPEALYVREHRTSLQAKTTQVDAPEPGCLSCSSGGGRFLSASSDGSRVLFLDERALTAGSNASAQEPDLYRFDVDTGQLTDLTAGEAGEHANVKGLIGASEDGSDVYAVAGGVLASNENAAHEKATHGSCEQAGEESEEEAAELAEERLGQVPHGRTCNIYLLSEGASPRFIATLPAIDDDEVIPFGGRSEQDHSGDWQAAPAQRTAEVTPTGQDVIFMSNRSLTGYSNEGLYEVFLYEAGPDELRCVSCDPSGAPPVPTHLDTLSTGIGAYFPISKTGVLGDTDQTRGLTADGSRVFFDSAEPLVPKDEDANGWIDVYEWERDGAGSCRQAQGCVYLLSGGTSDENSWLLGADASGDNVFLITRAQLVSGDRNENDDVYDARVDGVSPTAPTSGCANACQARQQVALSLTAPESETLSEAGNFSPPPPALASAHHRGLTVAQIRARQLAKALKACRVKRSKSRRRACEVQARKHYAPAHKDRRKRAER
jgi:hypothetical protein